jgi:nucleoid-associated protein YgaU
MKLIPWLVIFSIGLVGCSGPKSAQSVDQETPQVELSDSDEFVENPTETPSAEPTEAVSSVEDPSATEAAPVEATIADDNAPEISQEASPVEITEGAAGGSEKSYQVQKNETLMMIAFKLYGDYGKWKEIANYNRESLKGNTSVKEGMTLKYMAPAQEFVWNPEGLPYLIRTGDTLGTISSTVYQTPKKWKMLWENNRPLIKDPNKIFAGFTLYYLENGRDVATAEL